MRSGALALAAAACAAPGCATRLGEQDSGALPPPSHSTPLLGETAAKSLFVVNVVPDVASNALIYVTLPLWIGFTDEPGNLWPMVWIFSPVFGVVGGVADAWHGYPFWDPSALDEHRTY